MVQQEEGGTLLQAPAGERRGVSMSRRSVSLVAMAAAAVCVGVVALSVGGRTVRAVLPRSLPRRGSLVQPARVAKERKPAPLVRLVANMAWRALPLMHVRIAPCRYCCARAKRRGACAVRVVCHLWLLYAFRSPSLRVEKLT